MDDHAPADRAPVRPAGVRGCGRDTRVDEMKTQIEFAQERAVTGVSVYSVSQVDATPNGSAQLAAGPFKNPATLPAISWKN